MGSPPMPTQVDCPNPARVRPSTTSYVKVPEREISPTSPSAKTWPGMMPTDAFPGEMSPGQLGPMMRIPGVAPTTLSTSCTGTPSVMQTASAMPASYASYSASAANGGGTKMQVWVAPVAPTACLTVSKTGNPCGVFWPPLPGVTPPTTLVP